LTATGQLRRSSEYRFDIRRVDDDRIHEYITVKRGRGRLSDKWAIAAGEAEYGRFFSQESDCWSFSLRGADAFYWELEPALLKAQELCESAQQEIEEIRKRKEGR
jgi:hypothetical protein